MTTSKSTITSKHGVGITGSSCKSVQGHLLAKMLKDLFKYFGTLIMVIDYVMYLIMYRSEERRVGKEC